MREIRINWDKLNEVQEAMCEEFCYFANVMHDQDALEEKCQECPLNNIDEYPLGRNDWQE